jgi:hypothetical protein
MRARTRLGDYVALPCFLLAPLTFPSLHDSPHAKPFPAFRQHHHHHSPPPHPPL